MKHLKVEIKNGIVDMDFTGFANRSCSQEEDVIRALYGRMGVNINVEHSDNKREAEPNGAAERERV